MGKSNTTGALDRHVRPYLPLVRDRCKTEGREPRDYFLVIPKYQTTKALMVPRSETDQILNDKDRSPVARAKMERLLDEPCTSTKLLVLLTAGDSVEGAQVNCMMQAREPSAPQYVSQREKNEAEAYVTRHASAAADAVDDKGGLAKDYVAIGRGPKRGPLILPRLGLRDVLQADGYGSVLDQLDVPVSHEDELLWFYKMGSVPSWSRTRVAPRVGRSTTSGADDSAEMDARIDPAMAGAFVKLTQEWLSLGYETVRELGEDPTKYVNYVQWPLQDGKAGPRVFPRRKVAEELKHLRGTKKYAQLLEHFEGTPCDDVMLAIDVAGRDDICLMYRDKDKIPPFEAGKLNVKRPR